MIKLRAFKKMTIKALIIAKTSRNFYGFLKETKALISLNGEIVKPYLELNPDDVIIIEYYEEAQEGIKSFKPLKIVFENENYLVVDKEAHLLTIPSTKNPYDSVYNRVLARGCNCYIFNRLDKETQGLILIAKNKLARLMLKKYDKTYLAITDVPLKKDTGTIKAKIAKEEVGIKRYISSQGEDAITHYKFLKQIDNLFYYTIKLDTGRTHQIRVHFSSLGSPLINDELYGKRIDGDLGLICQTIFFVDPFTNEDIRCSV